MLTNEKLISQIVDILAYDFNIKYHQLKNKGLCQEQINKYMDLYQKSRIEIFKEDYNRIKRLNN